MPVLLDRISPFVREVKILKTVSLVGEWIDFDHVLTYIDQGSAEFILNGQKYLVQTGDLVLMPPLLSHIVRSVSAEPLIQYIVHFDLFFHEHRGRKEMRQTLNEPPPEEMQLAGVHPIVHPTVDQIGKIKNLFLSMYQEHPETDLHSTLKLKATALHLLSLFLRAGKSEPKKKVYRRRVGSSWRVACNLSMKTIKIPVWISRLSASMPVFHQAISPIFSERKSESRSINM